MGSFTRNSRPIWTWSDCPRVSSIPTTNDALIYLGAFANNCLRLLGQNGLTGAMAPFRHPVKRRRIKTLLQEIMYLAARVVRHARRLVLEFSDNVRLHAQVFIDLCDYLRKAASPYCSLSPLECVALRLRLRDHHRDSVKIAYPAGTRGKRLYATLCGRPYLQVAALGANGLAGRCLSLDMRR